MKKIEITSREEIINGEETTLWFLDYGERELNINEVMGLSVSECDWLDPGQGLIRVDYSEWESTELVAIINVEGDILRKGIKSIEAFIEENNQFIVYMSGLGMGSESFEFDLPEDETRIAVIDIHGNFILPPIYEDIDYIEETRGIYEVKTRGGSDVIFNIHGKKTERWEE